MSAVFNAADVQGNILRGYRKPRVRYLIARGHRTQRRPPLARRDAVERADGIPQITTEEPWVTKPDTCFNIGLTYEGLVALGAPDASLKRSRANSVQGMNARALKLGDVGSSAPRNLAGALR